MTLTQLEYLVAIDNYRNFSLAAKKSRVTQPTLSMQIKKLEEELGVGLIERSKQPAVPTAAGEEVIAQARVILREAHKMRDIVKQRSQQVTGRLQLGIIPTIAPYLMPYFAGPFSRAYPDVQLEIIEQKTPDITAMLMRGELDAGILSTPLKEPDITEVPIYYEEILLYLNPSCALAGEEEVDVARLKQAEMWMLTEGNCFRDHVVNLCGFSSDGPIRSLKYESGSVETLRKMVDTEGGYTLIPELAMLELPSRELRRIRRFCTPRPLREVGLVYRKGREDRHLMDGLMNVIGKHIPESMKQRKRGRLVEWK